MDSLHVSWVPESTMRVAEQLERKYHWQNETLCDLELGGVVTQLPLWAKTVRSWVRDRMVFMKPVVSKYKVLRFKNGK